MGALISRLKTKPTTVEQLENLEKEIKELEEFRAKNQRLQKLWVGRLLLYSSVLYLLTSLVVYFLYFPEEWSHRVAMALPFFVYPVLVWAIRKFLIFLFSKRTERNNDKLEDSKAAKKKILEEVMETETYKNAKLILERFDPEAKKKAELESTPVRPHITPRPGQEIRQRGVPMRPTPMGTPVSMVMTPPPGARPPMGPGGTPVDSFLQSSGQLQVPIPLGSFRNQVGSPRGVALPTEPLPLSAPGGPPEKCTPSTSIQQVSVLRTPCSPIPGVGMHPPGPPLARPILPKDRGTLDRVLEFLVGDGPQNRYALICQQCFSHNGMALKEEFEYVAFRCAYCYFMNPARKTRPHAPRLPEYSYERKLRGEVRSPGPVQRNETEPEDSAPPSGDEKEVEEDEGHKNTVEAESQSEGQEQQQQEEEEEEEVEKQEDEGPVQEEEEGRCEAPETESGEL